VFKVVIYVLGRYFLIKIITTFYAAGIRPQSWWEQEKAKKQTRKAMVVWAVALALLIGAIFLLQKYGALDLE
jgi:hypothetical protein